MDIEELGRVRDQEREKDSLQHLQEDFYATVGAYLADIRARRNEAASEAADPFSDPNVRRLNDELETAERIVEAIYERRVGKIVKLASFQAADMSVDTEGLTAEEQELCRSIVERIRQNRERVLATVSGESLEETERVPDPEHRGGGTATEADGSEPAESEEPDSADMEVVERTTVRITQDIGEIVGTDERTYDLAADDVVTLPTKNAEPLVSRGVAEPIE